MEQPRNPFELMMNPSAVVEAMERSHRLAQLHSRIYRPLDRTMPRERPATGDAPDAYDEAVDNSADNLDA